MKKKYTTGIVFALHIPMTPQKYLVYVVEDITETLKRLIKEVKFLVYETKHKEKLLQNYLHKTDK